MYYPDPNYGGIPLTYDVSVGEHDHQDMNWFYNDVFDSLRVTVNC